MNNFSIKKDKFDREMCPKCGRPLPLSIVSSNGGTTLSVYCRKCKQVSVITLRKK